MNLCGLFQEKTPDENRAAGVCCRALFVESWQSDRRYFVLTREMADLFAAWMQAQGIAVDWRQMEAPLDLAMFDRYEQAMTHLATAVGASWSMGEPGVHILEQACRALAARWQP